jgi:hypothetical protein
MEDTGAYKEIFGEPVPPAICEDCYGEAVAKFNTKLSEERQGNGW